VCTNKVTRPYKVLCLYVPALAQRVADVDPRMGSGTEDTPWRDHEGDDGAGLDEDAHLGRLEHSSTDRGVLLGHDGDVAHLHRQ